MALSKLAANSFDLTDNYALTGTVTGVTSTQKIFLIKNLDASSSATRTFEFCKVLSRIGTDRNFLKKRACEKKKDVDPVVSETLRNSTALLACH